MQTYPPLSTEDLIYSEDPEALSQAINKLSSFEVADLISNKPREIRSRLFSLLSLPLAVETFDFLSLRIQKEIIHSMQPSESAALLNELSPDDRTQFLQDLPRPIVDELVKLLPRQERVLTLTLLGYPEDSLGRLMTPDYIAVKMDWSIEDVLDHILGYGHDSETINVIYVVNEEGRLLDDINLREFFFIPRNSKVESLADYRFIALSAYDNAETSIKIFQQNDRVALPVTDEEGILLGIVTIDDILKLSNKEATADIQKIGGTQALDEPYMQTPFFELMKKRAGWLVILFVGELFTASAMGYFEDEISKAVILTLFLPLIISSGGNAGSQASTLIIRSMALGEITLRDWFRVFKREIASGLFLGTVLGTIGFLRVTLWSSFSNIYGEHWILIAVTIFCSLIGVVLWGTLSGALLPLVLRSLKIDPATASAPLVATLVDVTGIVLYFLTALFFLRGTLL